MGVGKRQNYGTEEGRGEEVAREEVPGEEGAPGEEVAREEVAPEEGAREEVFGQEGREGEEAALGVHDVLQEGARRDREGQPERQLWRGRQVAGREVARHERRAEEEVRGVSYLGKVRAHILFVPTVGSAPRCRYCRSLWSFVDVVCPWAATTGVESLQ